jgi:hypothetical protein
VVLGGSLGMIAIGAVYVVLGKTVPHTPTEGMERLAVAISRF